MKILKLKTLFLILIASAFVMANAVGIAAETQTGTTKQKKEEEIKPPKGEKWYEEGDEEMYKFGIYPVTPKEGITGGILIYYGHFVKPPYKVYEKKHKDGYRMLVNGLPITPGPIMVLKKIREISAERWARDSDYTETDEYKKCLKDQKKSHQKVEDLWKGLRKKYNPNTKEGKEKIIGTLNQYFKDEKTIDKWEVISITFFHWRLKCQVGEYEPGLVFSTDPASLLPEKKYKKILDQREEDRHFSFLEYVKSFEKRINRGITSIIPSTTTPLTRNQLEQIVTTLNGTTSRENKIKSIFLAVNRDIHTAKFVYYNFSTEEFIKYYGERNENQR